MSAPAWMAWICDAGDRAELRARYEAWAARYEADVAEGWSAMPPLAVAALARLAPNRGARLLDAGAGTGLAGAELARLGYTSVTGVDLSPAMLAQAQAKGAYAALFAADLLDPASFDGEGGFDGVIATGLFATGHADARVLLGLVALLRPGAPLVITCRETYWRAALEGALQGAPVDPVMSSRHPIYGEGDMLILAFQRTP